MAQFANKDRKVKHFVKEQYNFLFHTDFIEKCNCQLQPFKYFGLVSIIVASHKTLLFQSHKIHFLPYSLGTQKGTKVVYRKRPPRRKVKRNGTLRSPRIGMQFILLHSIALKARHLLIFNTDFCIEYFPQTRLKQRLVSSKIQTAPFAVPLRKMSLTVRTFKLFGEL